ncbi:hypothetical protein EG68_01826 [Paragonimus skrjabini miyazakii]|uniref:Protein F37C4.5 n=1 Tax=Paragonimus skrjabini miyazakii TaxID=59628 RepID=A0A8S9Z6R5_9TREM|nr:hypothetical protein EG68_01826 [Paragonimus skrjabini miyazakii]
MTTATTTVRPEFGDRKPNFKQSGCSVDSRIFIPFEQLNSSIVECLTDSRVLVDSVGCNGFACIVDGLHDTPPLVLPEGISSSLEESHNNSEKTGGSSEEEVHACEEHQSELPITFHTDSDFPVPPAPNPDIELTEPEVAVCSEADTFATIEPTHSSKELTDEAPAITEELPLDQPSGEQAKDFCFVEHSGLPKDPSVNSLERESGELETDFGLQTSVEPLVSDNGHLSEESCGSFQFIKSEPEEVFEQQGFAPSTPDSAAIPSESQLITVSVPNVDQPEQTPTESPKELVDLEYCGPVEVAETPSYSHITQPIESHSPSELSYQSETSIEGRSKPLVTLDKPLEPGFESSLRVLGAVPYDASMSTTVGVSEIMSDPVTHDQINRSSVHTEEFSEANGVEPDYRTSYDGGSSYHDDVPVEDGDVDSDRELGVQKGLKAETEQSSIEVGIVDEIPKPSFQKICEDLDRKNVVSHLQQCHSGQFVMHHPITNIRQQDIVVLNPQTGEVLGSTQHPGPGQPIHISSSSKIDILTASNGNGTMTGQPPNGPDDSGQLQAPYSYHRVQPNGNTGSGSRTGGSGSTGGAGGGTPTANSGGLERVRQVYNMSDCQMAQLTVFLDRALVCRRIRPRFNASEITEVLFEHLSPAIDKDSVRVEIRGAATILDVSYFARSLSEEEDTWTHTIQELNTELRHCQRQAESLSNRITRTTKQRMMLDTFADNLIRRDEETATSIGATTGPCSMPNHVVGGVPANTTPGAPSPALTGEHKGSLEVINPYDPRNIDTLHRFLGIYEEQAERLDASLLDANEELDQVHARMEAIEKELHEIELKQDERLARELSVLVEPRETGQVEMLISYVVGKCSWKPAYDIRIFNSDGTMKIVYYGMVQQATGEDWESRLMTLSTALPGTGGTVPNLGLQRVCFKKDHSPANVIRQPGAPTTISQLPPPALTTSGGAHRARGTSKMGGFRRPMRPTTTSFHEADRILSDMERETPTPVSTLQRGNSLEVACAAGSRTPATRTHSRRALGTSMLFHAPSSPVPLCSPNRSSGLTSSSNATQCTNSVVTNTNIAAVHLEVPRPPALIRCDNEPVRVTVGLLDLQPRYEYVTAPKRSLHAYLKATAVNRSEFFILTGQTNIYADNTFIGKSELPAVAQGEEFSCNLGAEHGIKVFYRPLFKYREGTGSGSKHATLTFKQLIEVRNTFDRPVRLMVMDQVPVSGEDKIKVNLLEPVIKHPEKYDRTKPIRMNKSNNVEWDLDLGPAETKELTLKYSIEHPVNEDLDVSVTDI